MGKIKQSASSTLRHPDPAKLPSHHLNNCRRASPDMRVVGNGRAGDEVCFLSFPDATNVLSRILAKSDAGGRSPPYATRLGGRLT